MKGEHSWRYNLFASILLALSFLIIVQIVRVQLSPEGKILKDRSELYSRTWHVYYTSRGSIFDRRGNVLASSERVYEVAVDLTLVDNPETIAFAMSQVMAKHPGIDEDTYYSQVFTVASRNPYSGTTYYTVADYVTEEELQTLIDWSSRYDKLPAAKKDSDANPPSLTGLVYRPHLKRIYPESTLASNILGYVNRQGEGLYGLEEQFNYLLAGEPQYVLLPTIPNDAPDLSEVNSGDSLVLTLDREIQARVEQILDKAINENGAQTGTIVVMDPKTGEILAMATTPRIDVNEYWKYDTFLSSQISFNSAISRPYEPGSVFKVITMASALDSGAVTPETTFFDTGYIEVGGVPIYNWDRGAWGEQDMQGCMQHSLNVCLAWVALQMGPTRFYDYMQRFGIGHKTGIDLAYESSGLLKMPGDSNWHDSELGTNAFGQGLMATPVQMLMAISAVANNGQMVVPHMLRSVISNGYQYTLPGANTDAPISAETARTLNAMLAVSLEGESSDALVEGYRVAGKTGTGQIATEHGYTEELTNASFVGWGPVDDPRFLVYVWLEKPQASIWGSVVAAPVFREVFTQIVQVTGLPPDDIRLQASK